MVALDEIKVLSSYVDGFLDMMKCMTCSGLYSGDNFNEIKTGMGSEMRLSKL